MFHKVRFGLLAVIALVGAGCATANKSGFLSGYERLHSGRHLEDYWSAPELSSLATAKIYVEPVETSRVKDQPGVSVEDAARWLKEAAVSSIDAQPGWSTVEQPEASTSKLVLAITYFTPGSAEGRIFAGELGLGHAIVQVEGRLIESGTNKEIACFSDRRRDSGAIGFEDVVGDAGPKLVNRLLRHIARDVAKELADDLQGRH